MINAYHGSHRGTGYLASIGVRHAGGIAVSGDGSAASSLVQCRDVTRTYTRDGSTSRWRFWRETDPGPTVTALDAVSVSVDRGELVGVTGPSGSGKSTLLHLVGGLDTPTSGAVSFDGVDLATRSERERARIRLDRVGFVFQRFHLLPSVSARANVALPLIETGMSAGRREERATDLLERVGLGDRLTHAPGELSGGEQQRVAIARALANDPDLVLADEPTGELDTDTGMTVLDLLSEVSADRAVVVASHDDRVVGLADRIIRLRDGELIPDE
jgi:putative ABC transport system ATP-binding protein